MLNSETTCHIRGSDQKECECEFNPGFSEKKGGSRKIGKSLMKKTGGAEKDSRRRSQYQQPATRIAEVVHGETGWKHHVEPLDGRWLRRYKSTTYKP